MEYVLCVGTNIGDRYDNLKRLCDSLDLIPDTKVVKKSNIYVTAPIGYIDQQDFYNAALLVESDFDCNQMLGICMGIEAGFGRVRSIKNGPRIIDCDMIFAQNIISDTKHLVLPHPRYHERRFVLEPLMDLFPNGVAYGFDFNKFYKNCQNQEVEKLDNFTL